MHLLEKLSVHIAAALVMIVMLTAPIFSPVYARGTEPLSVDMSGNGDTVIVLKHQRLWFKASNAEAVADEDALFATMLPPHLNTQLTTLNQELDQAEPDVAPLPSDLKQFF